MTTTCDFRCQEVIMGRTHEKRGHTPNWRAIHDDERSIMAAICHNTDLGDAWEWPNYANRFASMAFSVGLDFVMHGMTH